MTQDVAKPNPDEDIPKPSPDIVMLGTGREIYAHLGIVGIDASGEVFGGYDQALQIDFGIISSPLDRIALGELMQARWKKFTKTWEKRLRG